MRACAKAKQSIALVRVRAQSVDNNTALICVRALGAGCASINISLVRVRAIKKTNPVARTRAMYGRKIYNSLVRVQRVFLCYFTRSLVRVRATK